MKRVVCTAVAGLVLWSMTATAAYTDITIPDTVVGSGNTWWSRTAENQEVEPGNATGQAWDMEAFLFDAAAKNLQLQGGFNMKNGHDGFYSGDIFIDVNGDAIWGAAIAGDLSPNNNGYYTVPNSAYKWDYVIAFDRALVNNTVPAGGSALTGGYRVYSLSDSATDVEVWYDQNNKSNPFRYLRGGVEVTGAGGTVSQSYFDNSEGRHYVLEPIGLSFLGTGQNITFHFSEGCGNDFIMGQTTSQSVPDGGLTLALLGMSLSTLGIASRRMRRNQ